MKNNWQTKKLSEICEVIAGQSPEGQFYNNLGKGLPFYQGKKEFTDKFIGTPTTWTTKITKVAQKDDILMSVRAPVGPVNFSTERICIGRGLAAIRVTEQIDKDFLFYFLQIFENEIESNTGAVFDSINKNQIENIKLLLPSISEQKRIVALLDEIFEKIEKAKENTEKNLQNSRELFESYLENIFSNYKEIINIGEICSIKHGFAFKSEYFSNKGDYVLLTPGNFRESGGYRDRGDKQKYYSGPIPNGFILKKDDFLVAMTEQAPGLLGSPIVIPDSNKFLHNQRLGLVNFNNPLEINKRFFYHLFNTKRIRDEIFLSSSGVKVKHTSPSKILNIKISVPNLEQQNLIVKKLDELSEQTKKLEENHKEKLADLEELKKSVLQKAFAGELQKMRNIGYTLR